MSEQRQIGALKIAEQTAAALLGMVGSLPDDTLMTKDDVFGLFMDANAGVINDIAPADREMRAFVRWADEKGAPRPKASGTYERLCEPRPKGGKR